MALWHYIRYKIKYTLVPHLTSCFREQKHKMIFYIENLSLREKKPFILKFDGFEFNGVYYCGSTFFFFKNKNIIIFKGRAKRNNGRFPMWYRRAEVRYFLKRTRSSTITIEYAIYRDELYKDRLPRGGRKAIVLFLKNEKDLEFMENLEDLLS